MSIVAPALVLGLVAALSETPVGPERNASRWPGTQAEVSIAVDRSHPEVAVAASMNLPEGGLLVMSTSNGGQSWRRAALPVGAGAAIDADPMVAFDSRGTAFLAKIPVASGNQSLGIEISRSFDGGASWSSPMRISQNRGQDDKVSLAVDDDPASPFRDRVYVAWKFPGGGVYFSRSSDGGDSFSAPRRVEDAVVSGLDMAVAADGALYLAFHDHPRRSIRVMRSSDGGETFAPSVRAAGVRAGWYVVPPAQCRRMALVHASIAVDRSGSADRGAVHLAWSDYAPGGSESSCPTICDPNSPCTSVVYASRSSDGGHTWSAPAPVHETGSGSTDRYHQWIGSDPSDGKTYVAFKDTRDAPNRFAAGVSLAVSDDGGRSWQDAGTVSSASSAAGDSFQLGDYQALDAAGGLVYVAWGDFRDAPFEAEIYVSVVHADGSPSGVPRLPAVPALGQPPVREVPARP